jgi:hypothetical protein
MSTFIPSSAILNNSFVNRVRSARCCSFCHFEGHNINTCNDQRLVCFHEILIAKRDNLLIRYHGSREAALVDFEDWLFYQERDIIRAYAIKNCGALARHSANEYCSSIMMKIFSIPGIDVLLRIMEVIDIIPFSETNTNNITEVQSNFNTTAGNKNRYAIRIENSPSEKMTEKLECNICYETSEETQNVKLNCGHEYCGKCMINILKLCSTDEPTCAMCRAEIVNIKCKNNETKEELCNFIF